jgi:hypothetical protein
MEFPRNVYAAGLVGLVFLLVAGSIGVLITGEAGPFDAVAFLSVLGAIVVLGRAILTR